MSTMTQFDISLDFYGANKEAIECGAGEVLLIGPAETGKTLALLWKVHRVACKYPGASCVIARKTLTSVYTTVLRTWIQKILADRAPNVQVYGGQRPAWFDYDNGSTVFVAGLDKSSRILSAEHDLIYVNQAEEITIGDWETLTTRTTGRAGHIPRPQTIADANPAWPQHWIYRRPGIARFYSWHKDNPTLYDQKTGAITSQGQRTAERLQSLTGLRRKRLWLGQAAQAEGVVYEGYNEAVHLIDRFEIPATWRRIRAIDFGFTNPFVCQWWAIDGDGRAFLYREIYKTRILIRDHAQLIRRLSVGEHIEATICDHDAEGRAQLETDLKISTIAAKKAIRTGIEAIEDRLRLAGDGRPRLFVLRDSIVEIDANLEAEFKPICSAHEFGAYVYEETPDGKPNKEQPLDLNNHGMDAARYGIMYLDSAPAVIKGQENPFYA